MGNGATDSREVKNTKLTFEQEVFCLARQSAIEFDVELQSTPSKYHKKLIENQLLEFLIKVEKLRQSNALVL